MRFRNSTDLADGFLRKLVSWCCKQIDLPLSAVHGCQFTHCAALYRGRAWSSGRILCRISKPGMPYDGSYPHTAKYRGLVNTPTYTVNDRMEALVFLTAHELWHLVQYRRGHKAREAYNDTVAIGVLKTFRESRETLLADWTRERERKPAVPLTERRAAKVAADLARWQRKAKLAATKIRKLKKKLAYYDRKAAANNPTSTREMQR